MNEKNRILDSQLVLDRWRETDSHDANAFIEFVRSIEREDEALCIVPTKNWGYTPNFSVQDYPDILSTFLKLAKPKIISKRDDDFWIALAIKYSA